MEQKPEIIFTFPACMGGVASFNFNIINHSRLIKKFHSKVILIRAKEDQLPPFLESFHADEVLHFDFSFKENKYLVLKRLNKLLGNKPGCIVTDNALTVFAANKFKNPKTVFQLLHDFYYVKEAIACAGMTDAVIAHSSFFSDAVFASDPALYFNRSFFIPYGVRQLAQYPDKNNATLNLVFLGRMDQSKGVHLLYEIEQGLAKKNIHVNWTVIGKGPLKKNVLEQWKDAINISFQEPDSTEEVYAALKKQDVFIFPTSFEGTPVSIMECMANAIVTVTNDLPGGIRDLVTENTGFRCAMNDVAEYIDIISTLHNDRNKLDQLQQQCYRMAHEHYDIENNADHYFEKFLEYDSLKRKEKHAAVMLSKLDKPWLPNWFVKGLRNLK